MLETDITRLASAIEELAKIVDEQHTKLQHLERQLRDLKKKVVYQDSLIHPGYNG